MFRAQTWVIWLAMAALTLWQTRNPFYLLITLLCLHIVREALLRTRATGADLPSPALLGPLLIPLSALLNALWTRAGSTVLFRLPAWLPLLGGGVTLEALVYGALNGLMLLAMFAAFGVLNLALSARDLLSLVPRAFHPLAVVAGIAITYVPATLRQAREIRDAQAVRGLALRDLRGWLPLFMPLLAGGLERALALSEAMAARGFAAQPEVSNSNLNLADSVGAHEYESRNTQRLHWLALTGLLAVCAGWLIRLLARQELAGWLVLGMGLAAMLAALFVLGRRAPRSVYHAQQWTRGDAIVIGCALALAALWTLPLLDTASLGYYPYPALTLPRFNPLLGCALLLLTAPAALLIAKSRS